MLAVYVDTVPGDARRGPGAAARRRLRGARRGGRDAARGRSRPRGARRRCWSATAPSRRRSSRPCPSWRSSRRSRSASTTSTSTAAAAHGAWVANVPDATTEEVATTSLAMALGLVRHLPFLDRHARDGGWDCFATGPRRRPSSLTLGIVGMGRTGRALAAPGGTGLRHGGRPPTRRRRPSGRPASSGSPLDDLLDGVRRARAARAGRAGARRRCSTPPRSARLRHGAPSSSTAHAARCSTSTRCWPRSTTAGWAARRSTSCRRSRRPPDAAVLRHPRVVVTPHAAFWSRRGRARRRAQAGRQRHGLAPRRAAPEPGPGGPPMTTTTTTLRRRARGPARGARRRRRVRHPGRAHARDLPRPRRERHPSRRAPPRAGRRVHGRRLRPRRRPPGRLRRHLGAGRDERAHATRPGAPRRARAAGALGLGAPLGARAAPGRDPRPARPAGRHASNCPLRDDGRDAGGSRAGPRRGLGGDGGRGRAARPGARGDPAGRARRAGRGGRAARARAPRRASPPPPTSSGRPTLLAGAARPAIVLGGGARRAGDAACQLADRLAAPLGLTINAKGAVDPRHPLVVASRMTFAPADRLFLDADVVLAVGTQLSELDWWALDCAIRTVRRADPRRPRPRRDGRRAGARRADRRRRRPRRSRPWPTPWPPARCGPDGSGPERVAAALRDLQLPDEIGVHLPLVDALDAALPADRIVAVDSTQPGYTSNHVLDVERPGSWLSPIGYGCLGCALPMAIGAKLAAPERPVLALAGDGGVLFTIQELATARDLGLPLPLVVWNNDGYGEIRDSMASIGIPPLGTDASAADFVPHRGGLRLPRRARAVHRPRRRARPRGADRPTGPTLIEVGPGHGGRAWLGAEPSPRAIPTRWPRRSTCWRRAATPSTRASPGPSPPSSSSRTTPASRATGTSPRGRRSAARSSASTTGPRAPAAARPGLFELVGPASDDPYAWPDVVDRRNEIGGLACRRARRRRRAGRGARARGPAAPGARRRAGGRAGGGRRAGRLVPLAGHRRTARRHPHPADGRRPPAGGRRPARRRPTTPAAGGASTPPGLAVGAAAHRPRGRVGGAGGRPGRRRGAGGRGHRRHPDGRRPRGLPAAGRRRGAGALPRCPRGDRGGRRRPRAARHPRPRRASTGSRPAPPTSCTRSRRPSATRSPTCWPGPATPARTRQARSGCAAPSGRPRAPR